MFILHKMERKGLFQTKQLCHGTQLDVTYDGELKYSKCSVLKTNDTIDLEICKNIYFLVYLSPNDNENLAGLVNFDIRILWRNMKTKNSLYLACKYALIFVRGHYLFQEPNSFPRAKLEENCDLRSFWELSFSNVFKRRVILSAFKISLTCLKCSVLSNLTICSGWKLKVRT